MNDNEWMRKTFLIHSIGTTIGIRYIRAILHSNQLIVAALKNVSLVKPTNSAELIFLTQSYGKD